MDSHRTRATSALSGVQNGSPHRSTGSAPVTTSEPSSLPEYDRSDPTVVDLYWIPLGAGSPLVRASGRIFERLSAWRERRPSQDLYHAALQVQLSEVRYSIEQAPVPDANGPARGVVAEGPVGLRLAGRFRRFRYEVRCWPEGNIPDLAYAVESPIRLTTDKVVARRLVRSLPGVPTPVWGRIHADTGEMWNSNSVVAWVLSVSGIDAESVALPVGGRAPGWAAGCLMARRVEQPSLIGSAPKSARPR